VSDTWGGTVSQNRVKRSVSDTYLKRNTVRDTWGDTVFNLTSHRVYRPFHKTGDIATESLWIDPLLRMSTLIHKDSVAMSSVCVKTAVKRKGFCCLSFMWVETMPNECVVGLRVRSPDPQGCRSGGHIASPTFTITIILILLGPFLVGMRTVPLSLTATSP